MLATLVFSGTSQSAQAQDFLDGFATVGEIRSESGINFEDDPVAFIGAIINVILSLLGIVAAAVLIYGGFVYITSTGDEQKISRAKSIILYAVIGLIVVGISGILVNVIIGLYSS